MTLAHNFDLPNNHPQSPASSSLVFLQPQPAPAGAEAESAKNSSFDDDYDLFPNIVSIPVEHVSADDDSSRRSSLLSTPKFTTISPDEIFAQNLSSSLLTSPFDSPTDLYEASPLFDTSNLGHSKDWPSLFPPIPPVAPPEVVVALAAVVSPPSLSPSDGDADDDAHNRLSASPEDGVIVSTDGSVVGISERKRKRVTSQSYTRRPRADPLPPIVVNNAKDEVALKRARNTLAARRSRERKMLRLTDLEQQVEELIKEKQQAFDRIEQLEAELAKARGLL
ncbi:hypothetical protein V1514DRAFT_49574 [Lipomyces japonicus]|uniref:uncharacterized protein n=1 Tax=Lipomyces japonicus TaxID=56871 RepID=UPI0034CE8232